MIALPRRMGEKGIPFLALKVSKIYHKKPIPAKRILVLGIDGANANSKE